MKKEKSPDRILLAFSMYACVRKHLSELAENGRRFLLTTEDTGLSQDIMLMLAENGESIWIGGQELNGKAPIYFYTERNEKLLLLLSAKMDHLTPTKRIMPERDGRLQVGNSFKNQIFYDCFSLIDVIHAEIYRDGEGYGIVPSDAGGVYVNGKTLTSPGYLRSGDSVDIYGLHIQILKELLVCVPFCGDCRIVGVREGKGIGLPVASGNLKPQAFKSLKTPTPGTEDLRASEKEWMSGHGEKTWIERWCGQEQELHTGEVEVLLPEMPAREHRQPLLLNLGPTLTMVLPILLMAQLGNRLMEGVGSSFYHMSVAMSGSSALLALFWGLVNHIYGKHAKRQEEKGREKQYREYLEGIEGYLDGYRQENRRILEQRYPIFSSFLGDEKVQARVLWNRYYRQKDFLFLRIGEGEIPFQVQVKLSGSREKIVRGKLAEKAQELAGRFRVLKDAPVGIDLFEDRQVGLIGEGSSGVLFQLLGQIMAIHCYTEVKTACFYRKGRALDETVAGCMKWMPHSWSPDGKTRFLAGSGKETARILPVLTKEILRGAETSGEGVKVPWYIVVVLDEEFIFGESLYGYLTDPGKKYPVSALFLGKDREELPKCCRFFVKSRSAMVSPVDQDGVERLDRAEKTDGVEKLDKTGRPDRMERTDGEIISLGEERIIRQDVLLETCGDAILQQYVRRVSGFQVREAESSGQLPEQVAFLHLYGCSRVEELESGLRWRSSRPEERLKVPIGCRGGDNVVSLDVHEKFHGPHGLIAGTTGSGKSELLQTYLLSLAVSFSPADVNFFMIDYKGGGTGNLLKELPHCSGVISNLSGKQIKRAMSAISSENKRRQRIFGEYQVNHIDAYTRLYREGKAALPMPHLILVVDEFAELKKEEPEFMQEIISLAQVGRSLGVHLILATQKPAGTVDDKIWSNARFRLCLRVQDRQDSMDMLHNGDAALLTGPGQCYLQIGNHEYYELFQTGYCGGAYVEEGGRKVRAALLENTGERLESPEIKISPGEQSQIEVLVSYLVETARSNGYEKAQALWLPELPEKVLVGEIGSLYTQVAIQASAQNERFKETFDEAGALGPRVILGLCDDPENQRQFVLYYEPAVQGHLALCGGPATGKSSFLKTILWQLATDHTPLEVQFLAVDMGQGGGFESFLSMPNALAVLKDKRDKNIFFYHLERLVKERQKILSGSSIIQHNRSGRGKLAFIFLLIDNFSSLSKLLDEGQQELLLRISAQGVSLGIYILLTAMGVGEIGGKLYEKIKTTLALEVSDRFQYGDILRQYYIPVLPKENQKGRGLCKVSGKVLEFQCALSLGEQEGYEYSRLVEETGKEKTKEVIKAGDKIPEKFPVLPKEPVYKRLVDDHSWEGEGIPLGYCLATGEIALALQKEAVCFLVSGGERTGRTNLLCCLIEGTLKKAFQAVVIDTGKRLGVFQDKEGVIYLEREEEIEEWQEAFRKVGSEDKVLQQGEMGMPICRDAGVEKKKISIFISDIGRFCDFLYRAGAGREGRIEFWEEATMGKGKIDFMAAIYHPGRDHEAAVTGFFREFISWQQGIHLGGNAAAQRALSFDDLSYAKQNQHEPVGIGYFKNGPDAKTREILLPRYERYDS